MKGDGLYKRPGSPYWYFKIMEAGRRREVSTKTRKYAEARKVRADAMRDQREGNLPQRELARLSFECVVESYLRTAAIRLKASSLTKEKHFLFAR